MTPETLQRLQTARRERQPAVLATWLDDGSQVLVTPPQSAASPDLTEVLDRALNDDRSQTVDVDGRPVFLHVFNTPLRLIVVGAVHIAEPLTRYATMSGYDVTLIDPRRAFVERDKFPDIAIMDTWPDEALKEIAPDRRTAIVTLTHDPKIDDPALHVALRSPVFYIGSLGSKRTHAKRIERLTDAGFSDDEITRIHAPIGLDIGGKSPQEIALSIMAEIVAVHRGKAS